MDFVDQLNELRNNIGSMKTQIDIITAERTKLATELNSVQGSLRIKEAEIKHLHQVCSDKDRVTKFWREKAERYESRCIETRTELKLYMNSYKEHQAQIAELKATSELYKQQRDDAEYLMMAEDEDVLRLKATLSDMQKKLLELYSEKVSLEDQMIKLSAKSTQHSDNSTYLCLFEFEFEIPVQRKFVLRHSDEYFTPTTCNIKYMGRVDYKAWVFFELPKNVILSECILCSDSGYTRDDFWRHRNMSIVRFD
jgi:hypothetical protein